MGKCVDCGRQESATVPLAFVWDVWKYKERCRYGCAIEIVPGKSVPMEVTHCFGCGKAVFRYNDRRHLCEACYAGVPEDSKAENLYVLSIGLILILEVREILVPPAPAVKEPVVEAYESRICSSGTVAVGRRFRDRADNIWQVWRVRPACFSANMIKCVEEVKDMSHINVGFRLVDGKWCRSDYSKPFAYDFVEWAALPDSSKPAAAKTDAWATRKDYLAVEIDQCAGTLKIIKQRIQAVEPHERNDFVFRASNGVVMDSRVHPEYCSWNKTLYLRGYETERDNDVVHIPIPHIPDILQAVAEYNEHWRNKSV